MPDVRDAVRALRATPVVSAVAILSLALGIGANTAIFSILNALMLRALPVRNPQELVQITTGPVRTTWSNPLWEQLRDAHEDLFNGTFAYTSQRLNLARSGEASYANALLASGRFFDVLGVPAVLGRTLAAGDDVRGGGAGPVAVLSYGFWQRHFAGAPDVIGQPITLDRVSFTIVGVTGPEFTGLDQGRQYDVAVPLGAEPLLRGAQASLLDERTAWWLRVFARLKPGQTLDQARAALEGVRPQMREATLPTNYRPQDLPRYLKDPFRVRLAANGPAAMAQQYRTPLLTLMTVVAIVLLIACANVANVLLARAAARRHELSVRVALGASRGRIARQLLAESVLLAGSGALLGLLFAQWSGRLLIEQLSTETAGIALDLSLDWRVLAFTMAVTGTTALLFGMLPAWRATRVAPHEAIKAQGRTIAGESGFGLGSLLVVVQVALCLVLVVGAGLFVRTFTSLAHVNLGFDPDPVLIVNVNAKRSTVSPVERFALYERLRQAALAVPGVRAAAASVIQPVSDSEWDTLIENPEGMSLPESDRQVNINKVTPGWFATYGTAILAGRDVDTRDTREAPAVALVNEAFVRKFMAGRDPIGRTVREAGGGTSTSPEYRIIGVVKDAVYLSPRDPVPPTMYEALAQSVPGLQQGVTLAVRSTSGAPSLLAKSVGDALMQVDPDLTLSFAPFSASIRAVTAQERVLAIVSGFFGGLALLLAGLGLYGVMSYAVSRRRQEIGIRMALGSGPGGAMALVLRRVALLVGAGAVAGVLASAWMAQYVASLLFGLQPRDPVTLAAALFVLATVSATAAWLPAWRASRIDPARVLRDA